MQHALRYQLVFGVFTFFFKHCFNSQWYRLQIKDRIMIQFSHGAFNPIKITTTIIAEATLNSDASTTLLPCLLNANIEKTFIFCRFFNYFHTS